MNETKRLLSFIRRGVDDYEMIQEGDKIAVGVSAGKDSLTLLAGMAELRRFYPKKFELIAITIDMGFDGVDFSPIQKFCDELGVEYHIVKSQIAKIVFDVRKEASPCSLCAKMRRGALHTAAKELGCTSVALGHHFDDAVDTFMLNLFFEGRIGCFSPVSYLSRIGLNLIRPMVYMPEKDVKYFASRNELPVIESPCPADGNTRREEMNKLLCELDRKHKGLRYRIFGAMQRAGIDGFREMGRLGGIKAYSDDTEE